MSLTTEQAAKLRAPFPASAIGQLPKPYRADSQKGNCPECHGYHGLPAVHLDYVGHAATTDRLLSVDPTWTWEPLALDEHGLPALDSKRNLWIRLTVCGVTRIGVGDGDSAKECIGDAIRNAAMRFGVALDLWAKEDLHEINTQTDSGGEESPPPAAPPESLLNTSSALAKRMFALFGEAGITDKDKRLEYVTEVVGRLVTTSKEMTTADAHAVVAALESRLTDPWAASDG